MKFHIIIKNHSARTRTPYLPLNLSPVHIESDLSSDEEQMMLSEVKEDRLQVLPSHLLLLKKSVIKVLIALLHVILYLLLLLMMQKKICAKYYQISHLVLQKKHCKYSGMASTEFQCDEWNMLGEVEYLESLKSNMQKIPEQLQIKCLQEIFEKAQDYMNQIYDTEFEEKN